MGRRILIAPQVGADGVVLPHLAVAQALARRGHRVYFYAPRWAALRARQAGCVPLVMPVGNAFRTFLASQPGQMGTVFHELAERVAPDLLRRLAKLKIDLIITDAFAHLGAALAAERSGLPWASLAHNPWMMSHAVTESTAGQVEAHRLRQRLQLPPSDENTFRQCMSPHLHLLAWPEGFDCARAPRSALHVGPLGWAPPDDEQPRWVRTLGAKAPAVLVATLSYPLERYREREERLLTTSVQTLSTMAVEAVITLSGRMKRLPRGLGSANIRLERYVPHQFLMPHLQALVTHGGWGAIGRALTFGVPLLVVPFGMDMPTNAELCVRQGVGLKLDLDELGVASLRERLEQLLAKNSPQRAAVRKVARQIARLRPAERAATASLELAGA